MKSIEKFSRALILSRTQLTLTQIEAKQCNKAVEAGISSGADCSLLTAQALLLASQPHISVFPLFPAPSCSLSLFSFSSPVLFPVPFCPHLPLPLLPLTDQYHGPKTDFGPQCYLLCVNRSCRSFAFVENSWLHAPRCPAPGPFRRRQGHVKSFEIHTNEVQFLQVGATTTTSCYAMSKLPWPLMAILTPCLPELPLIRTRQRFRHNLGRIAVM